MKPKLFILAGIPGTGKSTWAHRFFDETLIISPDQIRAGLYEGEYDPSYNDEVFKLFHNIVLRLLRQNKPRWCVADSTALTPEAREKLRNIAFKTGAETHLVVFTNTSQGWVNNPNRNPRWVVPPAAMDYMVDKYARTMDDLRDGEDKDYDSVTYISAVAQ